MFGPLFRAPRGLLYLTPEERALVNGVSGNESVPSVVIGSGINVPDGWRAADVRARYALPERFLLYAGRIDRNKGADKLFTYYRRLADEWPDVPPLVLVGKPALPIPDAPEGPPPRLRERGREVRAARGLRRAADAERVREPVRDRARGLGHGPAGARRTPRARCSRASACAAAAGCSTAGTPSGRRRCGCWCAIRSLGSALGAAGRDYVRREYDWDVVESRVEGFFGSLV